MKILIPTEDNRAAKSQIIFSYLLVTGSRGSILNNSSVLFTLMMNGLETNIDSFQVELVNEA